MFSTITGWPHASPNFWANMRPVTSVALPAVKPTTSLTGFSGQLVWAIDWRRTTRLSESGQGANDAKHLVSSLLTEGYGNSRQAARGRGRRIRLPMGRRYCVACRLNATCGPFRRPIRRGSGEFDRPVSPRMVGARHRRRLRHLVAVDGRRGAPRVDQGLCRDRRRLSAGRGGLAARGSPAAAHRRRPRGRKGPARHSPARLDAALRRLLPATGPSLCFVAAVALSASSLGYLDILVAVPLIVALFAALDKRPALSSTALTIACLVKWQPLILLPFLLPIWIEQARKISIAHVALAAGPSLAICAAIAWWFWPEIWLAFGQAFAHGTWSADALNLAWLLQVAGRTVASSDGRAGPCRVGPAPPVCRHLPAACRARVVPTARPRTL